MIAEYPARNFCGEERSEVDPFGQTIFLKSLVGGK